MILCDQVDWGERASDLTGKLENRQVSFYRLGKHKGNTTAFAFEFWGVFCCTEPPALGCLWGAAWSGQGRAKVSLLP